ncbi:hypothetical protein T11_822 [Trichinella zimbabwensis]|uniref:Uncharacterized protein n=1 Tax=Trichinella zimbabwensis TaxID=268475 RepID=A0A0V1I2C3_9BILA|nr:hypothetical protein T11_822 [Trichinella zimbabwensis]
MQVQTKASLENNNGKQVFPMIAGFGNFTALPRTPMPSRCHSAIRCNISEQIHYYKHYNANSFQHKHA